MAHPLPQGILGGAPLVEGPQRIERRGEAVVVLSARDYARLTGVRPSFVEFLRSAEGLADLDLARDRAPLRDLNL